MYLTMIIFNDFFKKSHLLYSIFLPLIKSSTIQNYFLFKGSIYPKSIKLPKLSQITLQFCLANELRCRSVNLLPGPLLEKMNKATE